MNFFGSKFCPRYFRNFNQIAMHSGGSLAKYNKTLGLFTSMENFNHDQKDTVCKACTLEPYTVKSPKFGSAPKFRFLTNII